MASSTPWSVVVLLCTRSQPYSFLVSACTRHDVALSPWSSPWPSRQSRSRAIRPPCASSRTAPRLPMSVDAVRRRRVQPLRDPLPPPRLLPSCRRRPTVPASMVHPCRRGRALRPRDAGLRPFPLHLRPCGARGARRVLDQVGDSHRQKGSAPASTGVSGEGKLFIELDFPMIDLVECHPAELPSIPETLNGASIVSVHKSVTPGDLIVELSSGKEVADIVPDINEIKKCSGRGVIATGPAPAGSGYDFFTRFFCPKFGIVRIPFVAAHIVFEHPIQVGSWGNRS